MSTFFICDGVKIKQMSTLSITLPKQFWELRQPKNEAIVDINEMLNYLNV